MKSAFIFPGQGSQSVGMLGAAAENWPIIEKTFSEASDVLGYDLWHLCQHGPAEELNQTTVTQPALLAASVAPDPCAVSRLCVCFSSVCQFLRVCDLCV